MPFEITLFFLRLMLVALLYLFLIQVVLLVRRELSQAATEPTERATDHLVVVAPGQSGLAAGDVLALQPVTAIGRSPANDVLLPDDSVSSRHAQLSLRGRQWWLEDLGSTNGTRVNERALAGPTVVTHGDVLEFGRVQVRLERTR